MRGFMPELFAAVTLGRITSAMSHVLLDVVPPLVCVDRKIRATVAVVEVFAAVAVGMNSIAVTKEPFAPNVAARKMSVAIVPLPSLRVFAAVTTTLDACGVPVQMGAVFAAMSAFQRSAARMATVIPMVEMSRANTSQKTSFVPEENDTALLLFELRWMRSRTSVVESDR